MSTPRSIRITPIILGHTPVLQMRHMRVVTPLPPSTPRGRNRHGPWRCRLRQKTGLGDLLTSAGSRSFGGDVASGWQAGDPSRGIDFALVKGHRAANMSLWAGLRRAGHAGLSPVLRRGGHTMLVPMSSDEIPFQGPIALEQALFCLDCEVIFTDHACCPRCSGRVVWPLAKWLSPGEPSLMVESRPAGCPPVSDHDAEDTPAVA
jgi:hypothetical protein